MYGFGVPFPVDSGRVISVTRAVAIQSLALVKDALEPVPFWISGESARNWKTTCGVQNMVDDRRTILIGVHYLDFDEEMLLKRLRSRGFKVSVVADNKEGVEQHYVFSRPFYCNNLVLDDSLAQEIDQRSADELMYCEHSERRLNTPNIQIRLSVFFQGINGGITDGILAGKGVTEYEEDMRLVWIDVEGRRFRAPRVDVV